MSNGITVVDREKTEQTLLFAIFDCYFGDKTLDELRRRISVPGSPFAKYAALGAAIGAIAAPYLSFLVLPLLWISRPRLTSQVSLTMTTGLFDVFALEYGQALDAHFASYLQSGVGFGGAVEIGRGEVRYGSISFIGLEVHLPKGAILSVLKADIAENVFGLSAV